MQSVYWYFANSRKNNLQLKKEYFVNKLKHPNPWVPSFQMSANSFFKWGHKRSNGSMNIFTLCKWHDAGKKGCQQSIFTGKIDKGQLKRDEMVHFIIGSCQLPSLGSYFSISFCNARCNVSNRSLSSFKRSEYLSNFCKHTQLLSFLIHLSASLVVFGSPWVLLAMMIIFFIVISGCFSWILQLLLLWCGLDLQVVCVWPLW